MAFRNNLPKRNASRFFWLFYVSVAFYFSSLVSSSAQENSQSHRALSFSVALEKGLVAHPRLEVVKANREAAKSATLPMSLSLLPQLSLVASKTYSDSLFQNNHTTSSAIFYGTNASLNLFHSGADLASMRLASGLREAADVKYELSILDVESEVAKIFFNHIRLQSLTQIALLKINQKQKALDVAKLRYQRGLIPEQEIDKLRIEYSQALAQQSDVDRAFKENNEFLHSLIGMDTLLVEWPWANREKLTEFLSAISEKTISKSFEDLSSSLALRLSKIEADNAHRVKLRTLGQIFPSLDLTASYGFSRSRFSDPASRDYTIGLSLSMPLFDQLQAYSSYKSSFYQEVSARAQAQLSRRDTAVHLLSTEANVKASIATALERDELLNRAKALFEKSLTLFQGGRMTVNELSLDLDRWQLSQSLSVDGWYEANVAILSYCHARSRKLFDCH